MLNIYRAVFLTLLSAKIPSHRNTSEHRASIEFHDTYIEPATSKPIQSTTKSSQGDLVARRAVWLSLRPSALNCLRTAVSEPRAAVVSREPSRAGCRQNRAALQIQTCATVGFCIDCCRCSVANSDVCSVVVVAGRLMCCVVIISC